MSYQWLEEGVAYHRDVLLHEAEHDRLIALVRGPRQRSWRPSRVRLAQVLRALARVIEPRERVALSRVIETRERVVLARVIEPRERAAPATAQGCVTC